MRTGQWHRKFNQLKEEIKIVSINGFVKIQRIQLLENVMRQNTDAVTKIVLDWKPEGKRPQGHHWKRWMDVVEKDLECRIGGKLCRIVIW
jgi:hypothetical protein